MGEALKEEVVALLAGDALEAADHEPAMAAILLIDAALCIVVSRSCRSTT